jgi:aconitate hydratase
MTRLSANWRRHLKVGSKTFDYFSLKAAEKAGLGRFGPLPFSLKILAENLLRFEDGRSVTIKDIKALGAWAEKHRSEREIAFRPARVLMQDFTGVPAVVDLAAMRQAVRDAGGDPKVINPLLPVDLVIDHSVTVDNWSRRDAFKANVEMEYRRNAERYTFLRWGQGAFANFRVVPPGTGICHQVNLEYLAKTVWTAKTDGRDLAYPDTVVGLDSHTTMINGLSVLGWGVGGIEAEAAMLGQPISMLIPEVVGFKLMGGLREGATATDLVLTVTEMLRKKGVVGRFVEFFGPGLDQLSLADRATIANMAPEYGATCGFFPIDAETLRYLKATGRAPARVRLVEAYAKAQGLWRGPRTPDPTFTDKLELNLGRVEPSLAGPKRPQDRVPLSQAALEFATALGTAFGKTAGMELRKPVEGANFDLGHGDVVIAAITSCTNTSNPTVMLGAGLLARNALKRGLHVKPWVKTSLAPGSKVVSDYLAKSGVQKDLDKLGFNLVGYGCTTCIGNSGPLPENITKSITENDLIVCSVLSGNRNFEGRVHPLTKANYLASPMLVVAYALAGSLRIDIFKDPIGEDREAKPVYLREIWPSNRDIAGAVAGHVKPSMFREEYSEVFKGNTAWRRIETGGGLTFAFDPQSTYVRYPPYFANMPKEPAALAPIRQAKLLAMLGDSITTDHISPAGAIRRDSPAGIYLMEHGVEPKDFNSYGSRRGNHEVMMRGTFANIRLRNEMAPGTEGGVTRHLPTEETLSIFDAAMRYQKDGVPLIVVAGKEYGAGSSRDWAAKGPRLLGVRAVLAESFERIHRSNLVGMGVLPLQFSAGQSRKTLHLDGSERFDVEGLGADPKPKMMLKLKIGRADGREETIEALCRIDTWDEVEYYRHGGILPFVLRQLLQRAA